MINAVGNRMTREIARQQKLADALERTQIQISGGKKLLRMSDDPVAARRIATIGTTQASMTAWSANVNAADALLEKGATDVMCYVTHGVLSGGAVSRIQNSRLKSLVITDSILPTAAVQAARNIRVLSIAPLLGEAILRTSREESVSSLFY